MGRIWGKGLIVWLLLGIILSGPVLGEGEDEGPPSTNADIESRLERLSATRARARLYMKVLRDKIDKFPNLENEIRQFVMQLARTEFFPSTLEMQPVRPIVLVGPPSIGKTKAIREIVNALGLNRAFVPHQVREGNRTIPFQQFLTHPNVVATEGPQLILFIDEIQNLQAEGPQLNDRDLLETLQDTVNRIRRGEMPENQNQSNFLRSLNDRFSDFAWRISRGAHREADLNSHIMWHLLGNGLVNLEPPDQNDNAVANFQRDLRNLPQAIRQYLRWRSEMQANPPSEEGSRTPEQQLADAEREFREGGMQWERGTTYFRQAINEYLAFRPYLYRKLFPNGLSAAEPAGRQLLRVMAENPEHFAQVLESNIREYGFNHAVDASRIVIVVSGNDNQFYEDSRNLAADPNDATSVHAAAQRLLRESGRQRFREYIFRVFGRNENTEAFLQRLGDSRHQLPLTTEQVRNAVSHMLSDIHEPILADLRRGGLEIERMEIRPELVDALFNRLRSHFHDMRYIEGNVKRVIVEMVLEQFLALHGPPIEGIRLGFATANGGTLTAEAIRGGEACCQTTLPLTQLLPRVIPEPTPPANTEGPPTLSESARQHRSIHQASVGVIGSLVFGAVPERLSIAGERFASGETRELYRPAELHHLVNQRNMILLLLAGISGESEFMEETTHSDRAIRHREMAERLLNELIASIREMKQQRSLDPDGNSLREVLPNRYQEIIFQSIHQGHNVREILNTAQAHVTEQLRQHRQLVESVAGALRDSPNGEITSRELIALIRSSRSVDRATRRRISSNEPGYPGAHPCRAVFGRMNLWFRLMRLFRIY